MHSGGSQKEQWSQIYIEARQKQAEIIFYNHFGHNPYRVTCTCCGSDYAISESKTLLEATKYHRRKDTYENMKVIKTTYQSLARFSKLKYILIIHKNEIKREEKIGELPTQGYVWV